MKTFKTKDEAKKFYEEVIKPIAESLRIPPHHFVRVKGTPGIAPNPTFDVFRISDYEMSTEVRGGRVIFPPDTTFPFGGPALRALNNGFGDGFGAFKIEGTQTARVLEKVNNLIRKMDAEEIDRRNGDHSKDADGSVYGSDNCVIAGRRVGLTTLVKDNVKLNNRLVKLEQCLREALRCTSAAGLTTALQKLDGVTKPPLNLLMHLRFLEEKQSKREQATDNLNTIRMLIEDLSATGGTLPDLVHLIKDVGIFSDSNEIPIEAEPVKVKPAGGVLNKDLEVIEVTSRRHLGSIKTYVHVQRGRYVILPKTDAERIKSHCVFKEDIKLLNKAIENATRHV